MTPTTLAEASQARVDRLVSEEVDKRIDLLLSNFERVTADPRKMGYLRSLLKHYAKFPHPFTQCVHDNMKRFGPGHTEAVCAVLKDVLRQSVGWRGHPERDHGAPGAAIAEADKSAAPAFGGKHRLSEDRQPSFLDELDAEFGVVDHSEPIRESFGVLVALGEKCDVYRVLIGLDEPPAKLELAA